ncbi:hypothetical protein Y695_03739 [Hydrogenophaga sp. T4]|nr:hypothetical protein Y695_03739 [Hydrogenophaga sp. T4]
MRRLPVEYATRLPCRISYKHSEYLNVNGPIALNQLPQKNIFRAGDVFVLFGELFGRGYANGLVNEARQAGMSIIGITVAAARPTARCARSTTKNSPPPKRTWAARSSTCP